jgi:hypothetical protein
MKFELCIVIGICFLICFLKYGPSELTIPTIDRIVDGCYLFQTFTFRDYDDVEKEMTRQYLLNFFEVDPFTLWFESNQINSDFFPSSNLINYKTAEQLQFSLANGTIVIPSHGVPNRFKSHFVSNNFIYNFFSDIEITCTSDEKKEHPFQCQISKKEFSHRWKTEYGSHDMDILSAIIVGKPHLYASDPRVDPKNLFIFVLFGFQPSEKEKSYSKYMEKIEDMLFSILKIRLSYLDFNKLPLFHFKTTIIPLDKITNENEGTPELIN